MQIKQYESEWQGIHLAELGECPGGVADIRFYNKFYKNMDPGKISVEWSERKSKISRWVEDIYLKPQRDVIGEKFKVLSLGAGTGIIEKEWLERGYNVVLQECQENSLKPLISLFPRVKVIIGDARLMDEENGDYHFVFISALDYVFCREEYCRLLKKASQMLAEGGRLVLVCVTNLTFKNIIKSFAKNLLIGLGVRQKGSRQKRVVPWGWKRTLSEHKKAARGTGLNAVAVFSLTGSRFENVRRHSPDSLLINDTSVIAIEWLKRT